MQLSTAFHSLLASEVSKHQTLRLSEQQLDTHQKHKAKVTRRLCKVCEDHTYDRDRPLCIVPVGLVMHIRYEFADHLQCVPGLLCHVLAASAP